MSYVDPDFKSKRDLKGAVIRSRAYGHLVDASDTSPDSVDTLRDVRLLLRRAGPIGPFETYNPSGMFPVPANGQDTIEGPHYPKPHKWYARVQVAHGYIVKVLS